MWLSSFALLASQVAAIYAPATYYDYYSGTYYSSSGLAGTAAAWAACLAAAAGLGGLQL